MQMLEKRTYLEVSQTRETRDERRHWKLAQSFMALNPVPYIIISQLLLETKHHDVQAQNECEPYESNGRNENGES
jgi:hypothetical protein